jgi:hypothetical protein
VKFVGRTFAAAVIALSAVRFAESPAQASVPAGVTTLSVASGHAVQSAGVAGAGDTNFDVVLPTQSSYCSGDSSSATPFGAAVYIAGTAIDPTMIDFSAFLVPTGSGPTFLSPLFDTTGQSEALVAVGPTPAFVPQPNQSSLWRLADKAGLANGVYRLGIACFNTSTNQIDGIAGGVANYWESFITVSNHVVSAPGEGSFDWSYGVSAPPSATLSVSGGDTTASVVVTIPRAAPVVTSAVITGLPTTIDLTADQISAAAVGGVTIPVAGLSNGTTYTVSLTVSNGFAPDAVRAADVTPNGASLNNVSAVALSNLGAQGVTVSWNDPAANASGAIPTGYTLSVNGGSANAATSPTALSGLTANTAYIVVVSAVYGNNPTDSVTPPAAGSFTTSSSAVIFQDIAVNRPNGLLVMTQRCVSTPIVDPVTGAVSTPDVGATINGYVPAETALQAGKGFPTGIPPTPATSVASIGGGPGDNGVAPLVSTTPFDQNAADADPLFSPNATLLSGYPYPQNADGTPHLPNYPTRCTVNLGNAHFVTTGPNAGQYFAVSGQINQVTVVNTQDTDAGWTVTGQMSDFANTNQTGPNASFSGDYVGWTPVVTYVTPPQVGWAYTMKVTAGPDVQQGVANGLSAGATLASSPVGQSLGIAQLDARIRLLIPTAIKAGTYHGTLTFQAIG